MISTTETVRYGIKTQTNKLANVRKLDKDNKSVSALNKGYYFKLFFLTNPATSQICYQA